MRLERYPRVLAEFCTDQVIHLTPAFVVATIALTAPRLTAQFAALGLVGETSYSIKRLIVCVEGKLLPKVLARKDITPVVHW